MILRCLTKDGKIFSIDLPEEKEYIQIPYHDGSKITYEENYLNGPLYTHNRKRVFKRRVQRRNGKTVYIEE